MTPEERQAAFLAAYNELVMRYGCYFVPQIVDNPVLHNGALENQPYTAIGVVLSAHWIPPTDDSDGSQSPAIEE